MWIRIDPDMQLIRSLDIQQPDFQWQYQLKHERDVTAQAEAVMALERFPSAKTKKTLVDMIEDEKCYYRVRWFSDPLGRLTVPASSDHYFPPIRPSPLFKILQSKTKPRLRIMITTGGTVGLAEGIIDCTHVLSYFDPELKLRFQITMLLTMQVYVNALSSQSCQCYGRSLGGPTTYVVHIQEDLWILRCFAYHQAKRFFQSAELLLAKGEKNYYIF